MSFYVGQKVVCVDIESGEGCWRDNDAPTVGAIYTVTRMVVEPDGDLVLLFFEEIARGPLATAYWGEEFAGYAAFRFRPVVEDRKRVSFQIGADPDSERWDNRKKRKEKV